jgi:hypothetical protein
MLTSAVRLGASLSLMATSSIQGHPWLDHRYSTVGGTVSTLEQCHIPQPSWTAAALASALHPPHRAFAQQRVNRTCLHKLHTHACSCRAVLGMATLYCLCLLLLSLMPDGAQFQHCPVHAPIAGNRATSRGTASTGSRFQNNLKQGCQIHVQGNVRI